MVPQNGKIGPNRAPLELIGIFGRGWRVRAKSLLPNWAQIFGVATAPSRL